MALNPGDESQVMAGNQGRSIYDALVSEIAWKSFVAGFFLGLGKTVASLIFWVVLLFVSVYLLQPLIAPLLDQLQILTGAVQTQQELQRSGNNSFNQLFQQFGGSQ